MTSTITGWRSALRADPIDWLLEPGDPAARHLALRDLLDEPDDAPVVRRARTAAMRVEPIAAILRAQQPAGFWEKPGPGYATKYRGTVWSLMFLDQMGADPGDGRVRRACDYVLRHTAVPTGGFGCSGRITERPPPPSTVLHCLNGNLLRALLGFGYVGDERVQAAIEWEARAITGDGFDGGRFRFYASGTTGPGFGCAANGGLPCAWGAVKSMLAFARIPPAERSPLVREAIAVGIDRLRSRDPAVADYPAVDHVSSSWFKLGFPSGYVADVLQTVEALCELGDARDPGLDRAVELVLSKQDDRGRFRNEYAYRGKLWADVDEPHRPSKWVTLRVCRVLKARA